jgi:hypothetical protein
MWPLKADADGPEGYALGILQLDRVIADAIGPGAPIQAAVVYDPRAAPLVYLPGAHEQTVEHAHALMRAAATLSLRPLVSASTRK